MEEQLLDFKSLQDIIENGQMVKTILRKSGSNITIVPLRDIVIDNSFLQVTFRINQETLILSWFYLLYEDTGTGTKVIEWLIKYCAGNSNLKIFKIANVENNKVKMRAVCKKFGFIESKCNEEYSDFYLEIK